MRCIAGGSITLPGLRSGAAVLLGPACGRARGAKMERVTKNRKLFTGAALVAILATLGVVQGYARQGGGTGQAGAAV